MSAYTGDQEREVSAAHGTLGAVGGATNQPEVSPPLQGLADPPTDSKFAPGHPMKEARKNVGTDKIAIPGGDDKVHGTSGGKVVNAAELHLRDAAKEQRAKILEGDAGLQANRAAQGSKQT